MWCLLPGIIWKSRYGKKEKFVKENNSKILENHKSDIAYWLMLLPLQNSPKPIAFIFYLFSKFLWKLKKLF
jgi:hypothetical protein